MGVVRFLTILRCGISEFIYQKWQKDSHKAAKHLRNTIENLGPTFIKFGQVLSTRPDVLSKEYMSELEKLQEDLTPISFSVVKEVVDANLTLTNQKIKRIENQPLSSASIGQVHKAELFDGTLVVLKVVKPGISEVIKRDIESLQICANLFSTFPLIRQYNLPKVVSEYASWVKSELDMKQEASNLKIIANNLDGEGVIIPKVFDEYTTKNLLVMSYEKGRKVNLASFKSKELAKSFALKAITIATTMIFKHGHFHADPHGGNIFVGNKDIPLYVDFGMCGKLDNATRLKVLEVFMHLFERNTSDALEAFCDLSENNFGNKEQFIQEATKLVEDWYGSSINSYSLTTMIRQVMHEGAKQGYAFNPNIVLLVKTLYNLEGMTLQVYPGFSYEEVVKAKVAEIIAEEYSLSKVIQDVIKIGNTKNYFVAKQLFVDNLPVIKDLLSPKKSNSSVQSQGILLLMTIVGIAALLLFYKEFYIGSAVLFIFAILLLKSA